MGPRIGERPGGRAPRRAPLPRVWRGGSGARWRRRDGRWTTDRARLDARVAGDSCGSGLWRGEGRRIDLLVCGLRLGEGMRIDLLVCGFRLGEGMGRRRPGRRRRTGCSSRPRPSLGISRGDSSRAPRGRRVPESGVELPERATPPDREPENLEAPAGGSAGTRGRELAEMAGSQIENFSNHKSSSAIDDRRDELSAHSA